MTRFRVAILAVIATIVLGVSVNKIFRVLAPPPEETLQAQAELNNLRFRVIKALGMDEWEGDRQYWEETIETLLPDRLWENPASARASLVALDNLLSDELDTANAIIGNKRVTQADISKALSQKHQLESLLPKICALIQHLTNSGLSGEAIMPEYTFNAPNPAQPAPVSMPRETLILRGGRCP